MKGRKHIPELRYCSQNKHLAEGLWSPAFGTSRCSGHLLHLATWSGNSGDGTGSRDISICYSPPPCLRNRTAIFKTPPGIPSHVTSFVSCRPKISTFILKGQKHTASQSERKPCEGVNTLQVSLRVWEREFPLSSPPAKYASECWAPLGDLGGVVPGYSKGFCEVMISITTFCSCVQDYVT